MADVSTIATFIAALKANSTLTTFLGTINGDIPILSDEPPVDFYNTAKAIIVQQVGQEPKRNGVVKTTFDCVSYGGTSMPKDALEVARVLDAVINTISSQGAIISGVRIMGATVINSMPGKQIGYPIHVSTVTVTMENKQV